MRRILFAVFVVALVCGTAPVAAQVPGQMLFNQGCVAYDLVDDLGGEFTPVGQKGSWLVRSLRDGSELVYTFETIELVPDFQGGVNYSSTTFVAWKLEGTGIKGTNRTSFTLVIDPNTGDYTTYFLGETFRGNHYKSGGISGTGHGSLATGEGTFDEVRMVICKQGLGGH